MNSKKVLLMLMLSMIGWDLSLHIMETIGITNNIVYQGFISLLSIVSYNAFWTLYWGIAFVICICSMEPWKKLTTVTKAVKKEKNRIISSLLLLFLVFTTFSSLIVVMPVSKADAIPPAGLGSPNIYIFFAGWKGELGSPYWYTDIGDCDNNFISSGDSESYPGTVIADSANQKDWFYLIGYATDAADGVDKYWINWLDATASTWYNETYYANAGAGSRYYWNSSGNFTFIAGHKYSFDIWVNDTVNNRVSCPWQKKGPAGSVIRKYFYMDCPTSSDPSKTPQGKPLYLHNWSYALAGAYKDRFEFDQGNDLGLHDTGRGNFTEPTAAMEWRQCGSYMGWWYGEILEFGSNRYAFDSFTPAMLYYRAYLSCNVTPFQIGYENTREEVTSTFTQSNSHTYTDGLTTITYDDGIAATNNTYKLYTGFVPYTGTILTDNNIWEMQFKVLSSSGFPSVLSNESMRSFFWLLPDNATLNTSYYIDLDSDGISTFDELFYYNTDPNTPDSDSDGVSDFKEIFVTGSNPNNYQSTYWNWSSDPYYNYEKPRVSLPSITVTNFESATVNTTLEFGYNCSCGYWLGQTWPINEGNLDLNVTCTSGEYNHYDNKYFTYTFTGLSTGIHYIVPWAKNLNGFTAFNNFSGCIADHWGYKFNDSGWYNDFPFPEFPFFGRTSLEDDNTIEWFLKFAGIYPYTDTVYRKNGATKTWTKASKDFYYIDNSTDEPDYWYEYYLNDDNLNFTIEYSNSSTQYYFIQWPEAIWECNSSVAADDTIGNFHNQSGIYDDIEMVFMTDTNTGTIYSWGRDRNPVYNDLTNYESFEDYPNYHYFLLSGNLTNFTIYFDASGPFGFECGGLGLNCFNESNPNQAIGFDILISNSDGTQTYEETGLNNTHWLNFSQIPYGEDTIFVVSNSSYEQRIYYYDIELGNNYNLTFYLAPVSVTPRLYVIQVIDENYNPIDDVEIEIARYINETDSYENISTLNTDANGEISVYLIPEALYRVTLSKTGYETEIEWYVPDPNYYGIYYPKTFLLTTAEVSHEIVTFADIITFNATINSTGVIDIWYNDVNTNTTDTTIVIYEYYNGTLVWNLTDFRSGDDSFTFNDTGYNTSRTHAIVLYLNHSELGYEVVWIYVYPLKSPTSESTLEAYFTDVFGTFELGWVKTFLIMLPALIPLIIFSPKHVGLGIISSGAWLGFTTFFVDVSSAIEYGTLAGIIIVMGLVVIAVKKGRKST